MDTTRTAERFVRTWATVVYRGQHLDAIGTIAKRLGMSRKSLLQRGRKYKRLGVMLPETDGRYVVRRAIEDVRRSREGVRA